MTPIEALMDFEGRIARRSFLAYGALGGITGMGLILLGHSRMRYDIGLEIMLIALGAVILFWTAAALLVKRLHDLDLSGIHAVWIGLIAILAGGLAGSGTNMTFCLTAILAAAFLWLAITPGTNDENRYGGIPA